jgi:flagellar protein FlgJ
MAVNSNPLTASASATAAAPNIFDASGLAALKRQVKSNDPQALKAAAQQFEALFLQMVMKSMRDATPREGLFDSEQTRMYESLLDQQMAQVMGTRSNGTGLAAMIEKQLLQQNPEPVPYEGGIPLKPPAAAIGIDTNPRAIPLPQGGPTVRPLQPATVPQQSGFMPMLRQPATVLPATVLPATVLPATASPASTFTTPGTEAPPSAVPQGTAFEVAPATAREFGSKLWPAATAAARSTGIPPQFMVAQAALETGWGKAELRRADGSPSFNVFGIKAGRGWNGAVVEATTTEYVDGVAHKQVERFRAYGSYNEAFRDYAGLLAGSSRYAGVIGTQDPVSFARGLQRAGFATDPQYAAKLERIIGGPTLRTALAG